MKIRSEFVSNSSSCSFIVHLQSKKDIEEFKKVLSDLKTSNMNPYVCYAYDKQSALNMFSDCFEEEDSVKLGNYAWVNVGEDHDMSVISEFYEISSRFSENNYKFKIYSDNDAHYTIGEELR